MPTRATWQNWQFLEFKRRTAAILKIVKSPYLSKKNRPILMKFGVLHQILNPITVTWPKIEIFNIQDGGDRHLENRFFGHNSSTNFPISAKFYTRKQDGMSTRATWQKLQTFEIQHGGRPPFWKSSCRRPPSWKSLFYHYSSTDCAISAKFCIRKQNSMLPKITWQKLQICNIQDGGRPHFWKSLNRHISVKNRPISVQFSTQQQILNPMTVSSLIIQIFKI